MLLELYVEFGSNIGYSHRDEHTYAPDVYSMTSRELTSGTTFGHVVISAWPWGIFTYNLVQISLSSPELLTFFRYSRWRPPPSWIFSLCEFGHPGVLIVWCLCAVPNLIQISVIVTGIDAHMLQTFI